MALNQQRCGSEQRKLIVSLIFILRHHDVITILYWVQISDQSIKFSIACITEHTHDIRVCGLCDGARFAVP